MDQMFGIDDDPHNADWLRTDSWLRTLEKLRQPAQPSEDAGSRRRPQRREGEPPGVLMFAADPPGEDE